jgi:hypothetical protein
LPTEKQIDFGNAEAAGEFLASRIVDEARRNGVPMSDVERGMLYFSEPMRPGLAEVNEIFDRDYNSEEYEQKVHGSSKTHANTRRIASLGGGGSQGAEEDNYLGVMINLAGASVRPRGDRLKLWGAGLAICVTLVAGMFIFQSHC